MPEMHREMKTIIYVKERDGDFAAWYKSWIDRGYTITDQYHDERDSTDGRYGCAFEAQGPLETS